MGGTTALREWRDPEGHEEPPRAGLILMIEAALTLMTVLLAMAYAIFQCVS